MASRRVLPYRLTVDELELLKHGERNRTKRERLIEVRRQSHDIARRLRENNQDSVRIHEMEYREEARRKWQRQLDTDVRSLNEIYDERIMNLGCAHAEARLERDPRIVEEEKKIIREVRAKSREAVARKVLQEIRENETLAAARPIRRKKFARIVENERARTIISLKEYDDPIRPTKASVEEEIPMARRVWIAPEWPPTMERRKLLEQPISVEKPGEDVDPVAEAEAEREKEARRRKEHQWLEERRKEAAERRHLKALEQVRLASDYKKLMAVLKALQAQKIAGNQEQVKKAAAEAVQYDEESSTTPSSTSTSSADASTNRRNDSSNDADVALGSDVERRYRALLSAGKEVAVVREKEKKVDKKDEDGRPERSFGDLDYFPQRDPGAVSSSSTETVRVSPKVPPPAPRSPPPPSDVSPRKIRKSNRPPVDSSTSSSSTSTSTAFADSSSTSSVPRSCETVHIKGDVLAKYVARALDRLDISQLTSTPSSSTSISTEEEKPTKPRKWREEKRPSPPPPASVDVEIERKREEALRRLLKSSEGRLTPAEATWLANRICQKFKSASPSSSSTSSSTKQTTKGILKVSSSSGATTSTRDTVLREIDHFLRQLNVVLDETKKTMAVEPSVEYSSTTTSTTTTNDSTTSNGLLTRILEDFTAAAHTAAAAFGRFPREDQERTLVGETASESEFDSTDRGFQLVGETASSVEVTHKSVRSSNHVELVGETASSITSFVDASYRQKSATSHATLVGETASESDVTPEQLNVPDVDKITSTPKVGGSTHERRVSKPSSSSSSQPSALTVTPAAAIRAIPFDTSLSTIRTKRTNSGSPSSPDSPF